jgi:hypothetical protein
MADAKISQLPVATTPLAGTELVPVVQGGVTVQTTTGAILTGTVPSGTANGVLFLNGGKVVSSGTALTFDGTTFQRTGANSAAGLLVAGATKAVRLGMTTDGGFIEGVDNTGFGSYQNLYIGGLNLTFQLSGSDAMVLTSTGLGIGTSSPTQKLTVSGNGVVSGSVTVGQAGIGDSVFQVYSASYGGMRIGYNSTAVNYIDSGTLNFRNAAGSSTFATLDSSGNLGLGVAPSAWALPALESQYGLWAGRIEGNVTSNAYFNGGYNYIASGIEATRYRQLTGTHAWFTAPSGTAGNPISFTQAMTLDASGNLGIGVTNPTAKLHLYEPTAASTLIRVLANGGQQAVLQLAGNGATFGATSFDVFQDGGSDAYVANRSNASLRFWTNNLERARIPAAGGMVVGTAALTTTATDGFLYVPTCAGTPTGTPTTQTGTAPIVVDTTNNKLYFYSGGQWRDAGP